MALSGFVFHEWPGIGVLYCGDCLEILPLLEAGSVDAVVTDPPYGIYLSGGKWGKKFSLQWDREPANGVDLSEVISMGSEAMVWGGNHFELPPSRGWLVWNKLGATTSMSDAELCWTSLDMPVRAISLPKIGCVPNIHEGEHPTQKPVNLMKWCLEFIPNSAAILDPFLGSGTTAVACIRTGRRFIGIELEPKYCEIARKRIERELSQPRLPFVEPVKETQAQMFA